MGEVCCKHTCQYNKKTGQMAMVVPVQASGIQGVRNGSLLGRIGGSFQKSEFSETYKGRTTVHWRQMAMVFAAQSSSIQDTWGEINIWVGSLEGWPTWGWMGAS